MKMFQCVDAAILNYYNNGNSKKSKINDKKPIKFIIRDTLIKIENHLKIKSQIEMLDNKDN